MPIDDSSLRLLQARLQRRGARPVALVQTHISWLLLSGRLALKLKKPVHLPFLDFSTPTAREHFCREELRLNRRLAPSLYRAVLPLRAREGGPVVDHVLCMRRFPDGALLSERLEAGTLQVQQVERLAHRLARFHREAPAVAADAPYGTPERIVVSMQAVLQELAQEGVDTGDWPAWLGAQALALDALWRRRREQGHVREGHGDLHLSNTVAWGDEVTAFDCVEFDPALRWIDTMDDIAFLTMDLRARGRADLAWAFLDACLEDTGDFDGLRILRFHEVCRAWVRALVARLSSRPGPDYLACARALRREGEGRARLAILWGLSGSGKSTLARQLLRKAGAVRVRSDVERKRLFGLGALEDSAAAGVDLYTPEANRRTYQRLLDAARTALSAGYPVIVDAAFLRRHERDDFRALARERDVPFTVIACRADAPVLRERVARRAAARRDASEADVEVLERQLRDHESPQDDERAFTMAVDTGAPVDVAALAGRWLDA